MSNLFLTTTPWNIHGPVGHGEAKVPWLDSGDIAIVAYDARSRRPVRPELALVASVLQEALYNLGIVERTHRRHRAKLIPAHFDDALRWVLSDDAAGDWPFSFDAVCGYLGISAAATREQVVARAVRPVDESQPKPPPPNGEDWPVCSECGEHYPPRNQLARYCGNRCAWRANKRRASEREVAARDARHAATAEREAQRAARGTR